MTPARARRKLRTVLGLLQGHYGPRANQPEGSAVGHLVGTILSQNTSNQNSSAGYRQLWRRFRSWKAVANAPAEEIERCIRVSGLSRIKAPRIKAILQRIRESSEGGKGLSLEFLRDWPAEKAYEYLLGFAGIGPKTAACTLLFAFDKPVFPVDTHIHRIVIRLGLLEEGISATAAQHMLTEWIAPADRYALHVLLVEHGRKICRARSPQCGLCPLLRVCPTGKALTQPGAGAIV